VIGCRGGPSRFYWLVGILSFWWMKPEIKMGEKVLIAFGGKFDPDRNCSDLPRGS